MSEEEKHINIEIDMPADEESRKSIMAMGLRLALLQGVYDVTYTEIVTCLDENFSNRKVNID